MITIGIDPGKKGGISFFEMGLPLRDGVTVVKMPATERDLWDLFAAVESGTAYIERVHSSPQMGVVSSFTFGYGYGVLVGLLTAAKIPIIEVSPSKWQGVLGCRTKGDKTITKRLAQRLFPFIKVTNDTADALLIGYYGCKQECIQSCQDTDGRSRQGRHSSSPAIG